MIEILAKHSLAWLLVIAPGAGLLTWWLYFRPMRFTAFQTRILAVLRFLSLFLIAALLLEITIKSGQQYSEKPLLIWLEDHSASLVAVDDSEQVKNAYRGIFPAQRSELENNFDLRSFSFGKKLQKLDSVKFEALNTDISSALEEVQGRYQNLNVAGAVLVSDGIYNRGFNPQYLARSSAFPIHTVAMGYTTQRSDWYIDRLVHNEVTYLDNDFPVEINVKAAQLSGKSGKLRILNSKGKELFQRELEIEGNADFIKVKTKLEATSVGLQRYTVRLETLSDEANVRNNSRSFVIDVIDNRKKITFVSATVHPDIGAVKSALEQNKNYEVQVRSPAGMSDKVQKTTDLWILHSPGQSLMNQVLQTGKPLLLFAGMQSDFRAMEAALPLNYSSDDAEFEEVQGKLNTGFTAFNLRTDASRYYSENPPVRSHFGDLNLKGDWQHLLYKKVGAVATDFPLWSVSATALDQRIAVVNGEGFWKWRIYDFKRNSSHENFNRLLLQTAQYLTAGVNRRRFVVETFMPYFNSEAVEMEARLYNPSYELTTEGDITLRLRDESGTNYNYTFRKTNQKYALNLGILQPGVYRYKATASLGNDVFTREGDFVVRKNTVEQDNLVADHQLLRKIAANSGGKFVNPSQLSNLVNQLGDSPGSAAVLKTKTKSVNILEWWWLFVLFVVLLATEWSLRKYWGQY